MSKVFARRRRRQRRRRRRQGCDNTSMFSSKTAKLKIYEGVSKMSQIVSRVLRFLT